MLDYEPNRFIETSTVRLIISIGILGITTFLLDLKSFQYGNKILLNERD